MSITIRIGFIGVDGSSIALAAEPTANASAVVFSAINQLRRYFESHPNRASNAWSGLFHEIGQANLKDADERHQSQQNNIEENRPAPHLKTRYHAKRVISRKIALLSSNGEKYIPGHEIINGDVESVFYLSSYQQEQQEHFFWMDLTDPACRIQLSAFRPSSASKNRNSLECFFSEVIDQTPFIASWNVDRIFQRISEKCSSSFFVHPHDLECYLIPNENSSHHHNDSSAILLARDASLIDLFRYSRYVDLEIHVCRPPSITVRVVEADVAEVATKNLYTKLGFSRPPNDSQDQPSSRCNNNNNNSYSHAAYTSEMQLQNPYHTLADPYTLVESHSRRTISLSSSSNSGHSSNHSKNGLSVSWSTTLSELHTEASKFIAPTKGKGFICLEPTLILKSADAAAVGDHSNAMLKLSSTGKVNGSQVPVFSPDLTIRQVHRMMMSHKSKTNAVATNDFGSSSSDSSGGVSSCRLYLLVNSQEKEKPKMVFARTEYTDDILREADDVRFKLLDVLYPASREVRMLSQLNQQQDSRFKKQNVLPGSPDDTNLQFTNSFRNRHQQQNANGDDDSYLVEDDYTYYHGGRKSVQFIEDQQPKYVSPTRHHHHHNHQEPAAPTSPVHTEGVEAFISIPAKSCGGSPSRTVRGGEVVRLLLPDGYFPVRRLKRFLKSQASSDASGSVVVDYQIQFGTKIISDEDEDIKNYVNPDTNVVFLNAL